jgi:hypothetical protein
MRKLAAIVLILVGTVIGVLWGQGESLGVRVVLVLVATLPVLPIGFALFFSSRSCAHTVLDQEKYSSELFDRRSRAIEEIERSSRQILEQDKSDF